MKINGTNFIPLEGTINTRDLGGYQRKDGRRIKEKRLIRSDALTHITAKDAKFLKEERNLRYDIDFRSPEEIAAKPEIAIDGVKYLNFSVEESLTSLLPIEHPHEAYNIPDKNIAGIVSFIYHLDPNGDVTHAREHTYRYFVSGELGRKGYRKFLHTLYENKEGACLFHCADGKDRCGIGTGLLLSLLGRDKEEIIKDYLLTNVFTKKKAEYQTAYLRNECKIKNETLINSVRILAGVRENFFRAALDYIDQNYNGMDAYLHNEMQFTDERIEDRRDNYLE